MRQPRIELRAQWGQYWIIPLNHWRKVQGMGMEWESNQQPQTHSSEAVLNPEKKNAPAKNRTRGPTMATLDFTTKPLVQSARNGNWTHDLRNGNQTNNLRLIAVKLYWILSRKMRQPRIELGAQRWQRCILLLNHWRKVQGMGIKWESNQQPQTHSGEQAVRV